MDTPHIKNSYKNIKSACEKRLSELYPVGVPDLVKKRLDKELEYLKNSSYIDDFELARLLYAESKRTYQYIICRGTVTGSLIFYLISRSRVDPIPMHYACPKCGYFEEVDGQLSGVDLPEKKCPLCGETTKHNGFDLSIESVWGAKGDKKISFEYNVSSEFYPFIEKLLQKSFPKNEIVPFGSFYSSNDKSSKGMEIMGYIILSEGKSIDEYPDMQGYLQTGERCLTGNLSNIVNSQMKKITFFNSDILSSLAEMQKKTGVHIDDITTANIQNITWNDIVNTGVLDDAETKLIKHFKPKTFTDMINLLSAFHSTFTDVSLSDIDIKIKDLTHKFKNTSIRFYSRDDIFEELLNCGIDKETAFEYCEYIRKGKTNLPEANKFSCLDLNDDFKNVIKTIKYSWPRSHTAEFVITYALLTFYLNITSNNREE